MLSLKAQYCEVMLNRLIGYMIGKQIRNAPGPWVEIAEKVNCFKYIVEIIESVGLTQFMRQWTFFHKNWRDSLECIIYTRSREMSRMSNIFNFELFTQLSGNLVMSNVYNGWKQYKTKEFELFLANISKIIPATSDSFPLIVSH